MRLRKILYIAIMVLQSIVFSQGNKKIPMIIAHRGGGEVFPENTLEAFVDAASIGADVIELDTWLTADSQTVIIHDKTYGRTTDVMEKFGKDLAINELTLEEARTLFISGGNGWNEKYKNTIRIPTIDELMELFENRNVKLSIELKDNSDRNLQNILSSIEKYSISPDRIYITSFYRDKRYAPLTMKNAIWFNNIPDSVPKAYFADGGIVLNGNYFLTLVDSSLNNNEFSFDFSLKLIKTKDSLKTQYIFQTTDDYEWDNWLTYLRYNYPGVVTLGLNYTDNVFPLSITIDYFQENNIKIFKDNDTVSILVNGQTIKKVYLPQTLQKRKRPRFILGSDYNGDGVLHATVKKFIWTSNNDTLASYTFNNSLGNNSRSNLQLFVSNLFWAPTDIIGIEGNQYSSERSAYYKNLGYGIWAWTVNEEKKLKEILGDENIDGIVTDAPHLMKNIITGTSVRTIPNKKYNFMLRPAYPNPFNSSTTIRFEIEQEENITLSAYDNVGREIKRIFNRKFAMGEYQVSWDGTTDKGVTVSSGVYYMVLRGAGRLKLSKIVFVK